MNNNFMKYILLFILLGLFIQSCSSIHVSQKRLSQSAEISVKKFGAMGNGVENDTKAFQEAMDYLYHTKSNTLFIPKGIYILNSVVVYPGLTIYGEEGTVLKKAPSSTKFDRMFTTSVTTKFSYNRMTDSKPLVIRKIMFDGNYENQGNYLNYELEHQHLIFIAANRSSKGRIKAEIHDCYFKNGVADAISIYTNSDVIVKNCIAENVFRGGVTITGGNSKVLVDGFKAFGDKHLTGIDVEIDGAGFQENLNVEVIMKNMDLAGDFDVAFLGGFFRGDSILVRSSPFNLYAPKGNVEITNSKFYLTRTNGIRFPKKVTITNSIFETKGRTEDEVLLKVINVTSENVSKNNSLTFINCAFNAKEMKGNYAIQISPDDSNNNNHIKLEGCKFNNFKRAIYLPQGGSLKVKNCSFSGDKALETNATRNYNYVIDIEKCDFKNVRKVYLQHNVTNASMLKIDNNIH